MKVTVYKEIREKYAMGLSELLGEREGPITEIVLHGTGGGGSAASLFKWMMGGQRSKDYLKGIGLFHYIVDLDGTVYEVLNPEQWCFHSSSGIHDKKTIGIEHVNPDLVEFPMKMNRKPYPAAQMKGSADLITYLLKQYPSIKTITGHGQNAKKYSNFYENCPGAYNWQKLVDELKLIGYTLDASEETLSNIDIT